MESESIRVPRVEDMTRVSASTLIRNIGQYMDESLRRGVVVQRHGRDTVVIVDVEEWKRLQGTLERQTPALSAEGAAA